MKEYYCSNCSREIFDIQSGCSNCGCAGIIIVDDLMDTIKNNDDIDRKIIEKTIKFYSEIRELIEGEKDERKES